jgi:hypothetical protein
MGAGCGNPPSGARNGEILVCRPFIVRPGSGRYTAIIHGRTAQEGEHPGAVFGRRALLRSKFEPGALFRTSGRPGLRTQPLLLASERPLRALHAVKGAVLNTSARALIAASKNHFSAFHVLTLS